MSLTKIFFADNDGTKIDTLFLLYVTHQSSVVENASLFSVQVRDQTTVMRFDTSVSKLSRPSINKTKTTQDAP